MRVLVTGGSGFVGKSLLTVLMQAGIQPRAALRRPCIDGIEEGAAVVVGNIDTSTDWSVALKDIDAIVHLAARVHIMKDNAMDSHALYHETNVLGTLNLARQAVEAGVKRFVFISTIKVNGEGRDAPYLSTDAPAPEDAYALSKWEAEQGLRQIAQETGLEVVVLRPPLVYGLGVKANFLRLMQTVQRGVPLPLGALSNRRSLLFLGNFVDAIRVCVEHPAAAGQTFLLDDGKPVSTPELIEALAHALGCKARLIAVPLAVLQWGGTVLGKRAAVDRLTGSLWLDASPIRTRLGWTPPYSLQAGLALTVAGMSRPGTY